MKIKECMKTNLQTATPGLTILEAARKMRSKNIGSLPVIENRHPVGYLTDRDIALRCVADNKSPENTTVRDCMSDQIVTVSLDAPLETASQIMCDKKVRRIMVVDEQNNLVGQLNFNELAEKAENPSTVMEKFYKKIKGHTTERPC